jgi:hypothetical protein
MSHVGRLTDTKLTHLLEDAVRSSAQAGSFFPRIKEEFRTATGEVNMDALRASEAYKSLVTTMAKVKTVKQIDAVLTDKVADFVNAVAADAAPNNTGKFTSGSLAVDTLVNGMKSVVSNHRDVGAGMAA